MDGVKVAIAGGWNCACGAPMMFIGVTPRFGPPNLLTCSNPECPNSKKRFVEPTFELKAIEDL